jgi:glycerol-3-phosphate dehydrogenase
MVQHSSTGGENADGTGGMSARTPGRTNLSDDLLAPPDSSALGPVQRTAALAALRATTPADPLDVLVVGGGVVGCGAVLDAATRGLRVALVESGDLAVGTSSRSSRLAHGGLRYLEQREFALVHEALTERGLLLDRIAPHLVRPVPFLLPVSSPVERSYFGAGVQLYDLLSRIGAYGGTMPRPRNLSPAAVRALAPGLQLEGNGGAVRFHDAQIDDARHTMALARTAAAAGAGIATGVRVVELLRVPDAGATEHHDQPGHAAEHLLPEHLSELHLPELHLPERHHGARPVAGGEAQPAMRVVGAVVQDADTGERITVHARVVLSATGVWTDDLVAMATGTERGQAVRRSKGVHLVVPREAFASTSAVITRTPHSVLFLLPWSEHWLIGTTDTDDDGPRSAPGVDAEDVEYLLGQANRWLTRPLTPADVVGVYAGLRPLLSAGQGDTTELSREHAVMKPVPGFVAIAGGKYTTYRVMAADAVDAVAEQLPGEVAPSRTDEVPLLGAAGFRSMWAGRVRRAREAGLDVTAVERLLRRHGDRTEDVLALVAADPALAAPLHPGGRVIRAEAVVAARDEGARSLGDLLIRRSRLAVQTRDRGLACARDAAALMAPILGWDDTRIEAEVAALLAEQPEVPALPAVPAAPA